MHDIQNKLNEKGLHTTKVYKSAQSRKMYNCIYTHTHNIYMPLRVYVPILIKSPVLLLLLLLLLIQKDCLAFRKVPAVWCICAEIYTYVATLYTCRIGISLSACCQFRKACWREAASGEATYKVRGSAIWGSWKPTYFGNCDSDLLAIWLISAAV